MMPPPLPSYDQYGTKATQNWAQRNTTAVIILVLVTLAVVGSVGAYLTARDDVSYQAGQDYGTKYAKSVIAKARAGLDPPPNYKIEFDCGVAGNLATSDGFYARDGRRVEGSDVDADDFKDGCIDTARPAIRKQYNE